MNGSAGAPSSIGSACQFGQHMVDQRPRYESRKIFRRKLKRGRPAKKQTRQYWVK